MGSNCLIYYCVPPLIQNHHLEESHDIGRKTHTKRKEKDMEGLDGLFENSEDVVEVAASLAELCGGGGVGGGKTRPPRPPPPPYTQGYAQNQPQFHPNTVNNNPSGLNGPLSQPSYSPYLYQAPTNQPQQLGTASSRTLHIYNPQCNPAKATILDTDKTTPLYTLSIRLCKPHLTISIPACPTSIATAVFHDFHSHINVLIRGTPITLNSRGLLKSGHSYVSSALGGEEIVWKRENMVGMDLRCEDGKGVVLAKFKFSHWSFKKCGSLELMGVRAGGGRVMEEMVVMGMVMVEHELCTRAQGVAVDVVGV
ncbi:MAG: hypothetical protein L6R42_000093 [Xanthoria sp. 1 TBL-2021]|nr:MAG: hypothetical protein L6R42_000093 [Xanthoria sp. 1 TBL-2021]